MSALRNWHRFGNLPLLRQSLLLEAAIWLCIARLAILLLRFSSIARYLGRLRSPSDAIDSAGEEAVSREISWAIHCASRVLPVRLVCLPQALAAWQMLHRRGIHGRIHFGASRDLTEGALQTHAWLEAGGIEITGYPEAYHCVEIGFFSR